MKYILEMNHFLPTLNIGNKKKSNVQFDSIEIPGLIKKFFSRNGRNLNMISDIHEDGTVDVNGDITLGSYDIKENKIIIKFGYVSGDFICAQRQLLSLEGCPKEVGGSFDCYHNQLTSLKGCPKEVGGYFSCSENDLTSLKGCPQKVGGDFYCFDNKLSSLKGCPKEVGGDFCCENNQLTSFEGCPQEVRGNFYCYDNPGNFTEDDVRQYCNVKGEIKV